MEKKLLNGGYVLNTYCKALLFLLLFTAGSVWAQTSTIQLASGYLFGTTSGSTKASTSGTSITWTVTTTAGAIQNTWNSANYLGQQFGTGTTAWTGTFTTPAISGATITQIDIRANTGGAATLAASVGGTAFSPATQSVTKNSSATDANLATYTFTGSQAGAITITVSGTSAAFYLNRIAITYSSGKTVTFDKNAADATGTMANQTASIATNLTANAFSRTGYSFSKWNTAANGTGTDYANNASYPFTADATLYAQWISTPTVTTTTVSSITTTGASSGGNVTSDGGASVSARGVYFGIAATPTTGTSNGTGTGTFTSTLSSLSVNTRYYYRAYATNSAGTSYGTESNFYTLANVPSAPTVGTPAISSLNVAVTSGDGNPSITTYAIYETTTGKYVQADGSLGTSAVWQTASAWGTKTVTGLTAATTYTFEVKARNGDSVETAFGATANGTTSANQSLDWGNLQYISTPTTYDEGTTTNTVYSQVYKNGVTNSAGQGSGILVWIGYSTSNTNPNTWTTWVPAVYNTDSGNNDEYKATLPTLTPGTYYVASRFNLNGGTYQYGGTGGLWNNDSGVITVNHNLVGWANIQSPISGTITVGGNYNVYSQVYKSGTTGNANSHNGITAWIGYNSSNVSPVSGSGWTWVPASRNTSFSNTSNDEYTAEIGSGRAIGTYYYASRYQVTGSTEYFYGGHSGSPGTGGAWDGTTNISGTLTVNPPVPVVTGATLTGTYNSAFTYTISATNSPTSYVLSSGALPAGITLNTTTGVISGTPTAGGTYNFGIKGVNAGGTGSEAAFVFTVNKATQTITFGSLSAVTYGDPNFNLTATASSGLSVSYASSNTSVATVSGNTITITGAGSTTITASQTGDSNWSAATSATQTLTVNAKALTISGLSGVNKVYDRTTTAALSGTAVLNTIVSGDDVTLSGTPASNFSDYNVGTKSITVTGYTLSGTKAGNYTISQPTGLSANITAKPLTLTGAAASNKIYDGTNNAVITGTLSGIISPDVVTLNGTGTFASVNAANGIVVTSTSTLAGANAGNYSLTQPAGLTANITKADPVFTTSTISISTTGTYSLPGANISTTSDGTLTYSITSGGFASLSGTTITGVTAGSETLTVNQAASTNYNAASTTVTVNVSAITYVNGDWMSRSDGTWDNKSTGTALWKKRVSGAWVDQTAGTIPSGTADSYTVYIANIVSVPTSTTQLATAKLYVMDDGNLDFASSSLWTFRNIIVDNGGTLQATTRFTMLSSGDFEIKDGGTFIFNYSSNAMSSTSVTGSILNGNEVFHPNSNFIIKDHPTASGNYLLPSSSNITSNTYNGVTAYFGNLIFQAGAVRVTDTSLSSSTVYLTHKNLEFSSTATQTLFYGSGTWIIGGDLKLNNDLGGNVTATSASTVNLNVKGNFVNNSSYNFRLVSGAGTTTLNVEKDILVNSGVLDLNLTSGGAGIVNLKGNLTVASTASLIATNATTATFNFTGTGDGLSSVTTQTIDAPSTVTTKNNNISFNVNSGAYAKLINQDFALGTASKLTVLSGGTLDFGLNGTTALNVTGPAFTANSGSILKITSADGVNKTGLNTGNVQTTARTYSGVGTYHFIGSVTPQSTGNVLENTGSASALTLIVNKNNATDIVNLSASTKTTSELNIIKGTFVETEANKVAGTSGKLTMSADGTYKTAVTSAVTPQLTGTYTLASGSTIELNAADQSFNATNSNTYQNLIFSNGGTKTIGGPCENVNGTVTIKDNTTVDASSNTFAGSATNLTMADTSKLIVGSGTDPKPRMGGVYNLGGSTTVEFTGSSSTQIRVSATTNPIQYAKVIVSGTNVKAGTTDTAGLTFQSGGIFTVKPTGIFKVPNPNGFSGASATAIKNTNNPSISLESGSAIEYIGTDQTVTNALPYQNLTVSTAGTKTAAGALAVNQNLNLSAGSLVLKASSANDLSLGGVMTIASGASFDNNGENQIINSNNASIVNNGTFITRDAQGFSGTNSAIPAITNITMGSGSLVNYALAGNQDVSVRSDYQNLLFTGSGTKTTLGNITPIAGTVTINGASAILDAGNNTFGSAATNLTMTAGAFHLGGLGVKPDMGGTYALTTGTTIEFTGTSATQILTSPQYANVVVSGTNAVAGSASDSGLVFQSGGSFTVKNGAKFNVNNPDGFSGGAVTAIRNTNTPAITLESGSTIDYIGADQTVTTGLAYENLNISAAGTKTTASGNVIVNNLTKVSAGTLKLAKTADNIDANVLYAHKGINSTGGSVIFENNAQLMQDSDAVNTSNIQSQRDVTDMNNISTQMDYVYWSSPVSGQVIKGASGFSPNTPANGYLQYTESSDKFAVTSDVNFLTGKGYAIRAETGTNGYSKTYNFTGVPNNGNVQFLDLKFTNAAHGYNLIGNPYPSNIDFTQLFTLNNTKIYSSAWFWTNNSYTAGQVGSNYNGNNYAIYNGTGGAPATSNPSNPNNDSIIPNGKIKVGQGFIVQAKAAGSVNFNNNIRVTDKGGFFQKADVVKNRFWLTLTSPNTLVNTILIGYIPGATDNYETDFDGELFSIGSDSFYSVLGAKKLAIQGKSDNFTADDVVTLANVYSTTGNYTISLKDPEGIFGNNQTVYLRDKLLNKYINLSSLGSYTFTGTKGTDASRFEIVYKENSTLGTDNVSKSDFLVYRDGNYFVIKSSKVLGRIEIYDTSGRMVNNQKTTNKEIRLNAENLANGIYIIKTENSGDVRTSKIMR